MSTTTEAPAPPHPLTPQAPAEQDTKPAKADKHPKETIAGVAVPGGALTGLIVGCALLHFGGPLLLLGAAAAAAAGGTTTAVARSRAKANPKGRATAAGRAGGGSTSRLASGAATRTPGRPGRRPVPSPAAARTGGVPLRPSSATKPGGVSAVRKTASKTPASPPAAGARPGAKTGPVPPNRRTGAGAPASRGTTPGSAGSVLRPAGQKPTARTVRQNTTSQAGAQPRRGPAARIAAAARRATGKTATASIPTAPGKPTAPHLKKTHTPARPKHRTRRAWTTARHRTGAAWRWAKPRAARALIRTRMTLIRWRSRARFVKLRHLGPNWWPGLAHAWAALVAAAIKTGGILTVLPAARRWIAAYMPAPVPVAGMPAGPVASNVRVYTSATPTGAAPMADPVIVEAAEQIRSAFATIAADPANSMRGYEAALIALPEILNAVGEGLTGFADVTRDQFAVQDAVPDMLGEGATHAQGLASYLEDVHAHYRTLHEQQIHNYEEPTVGSEKWDVTVNNQD